MRRMAVEFAVLTAQSEEPSIPKQTRSLVGTIPDAVMVCLT